MPAHVMHRTGLAVLCLFVSTTQLDARVAETPIGRVGLVNVGSNTYALAAKGDVLALHSPAGVQVIDTANFHASPALATDGQTLFGSWMRVEPGRGSSVIARRFGLDGSPLGPELVIASPESQPGDPRHPGVAVEWLGSHFGVAHVVEAGAGVRFNKVDRKGRLFGKALDLDVLGRAHWLRMTTLGRDAVVGWIDHGRTPHAGIRLAIVRDGSRAEFIDVAASEQAGAFSLIQWGGQLAVIHDQRSQVAGRNDYDQYIVFIDVVHGTQHRVPLAVDAHRLTFDPTACMIGPDMWILLGGLVNGEGRLEIHRADPGGAQLVDVMRLPGIRDVTGLAVAADGRGGALAFWFEGGDPTLAKTPLQSIPLTRHGFTKEPLR